jgi:hypothetical protein
MTGADSPELCFSNFKDQTAADKMLEQYNVLSS